MKLLSLMVLIITLASCSSTPSPREVPYKVSVMYYRTPGNLAPADAMTVINLDSSFKAGEIYSGTASNYYIRERVK